MFYISALSVVWPRRRQVSATSRVRDCCLTHGCGEELWRYWAMEVTRRPVARVVSEVEWHTRDMRRLAVEIGRGKGIMFISDRAILAAVSATSLPQIPVWEGTHWRVNSQPSV
ncbi:uncharacterized protein LOC123498105 [Portunus trituberculatus]|uniref:uncharacterized protein LOC123498105 n=1 Tax=Portunus trituberculatus TaxID=210409 RepID=UPI001E1D007B|nr:uncharacterized protein LOC123498105 [Portunus trituberculatus]